MYVPTMSRGKNIYPAIQSDLGPSDSVSVMSMVEITESDVSDNGVIIGMKTDTKSNELKDNKSHATSPQNQNSSQNDSPSVTVSKFSNIPCNRDDTTASTGSDLKFPHRDVNFTGLRNVPQGISLGPHDVIVLDNIQSKPYPPIPISLDSRNGSRSKPLHDKLSGQNSSDVITESDPRFMGAHANVSSECDGDKEGTDLPGSVDVAACESNGSKQGNNSHDAPTNNNENKNKRDEDRDDEIEVEVGIAAISFEDIRTESTLNVNELHPKSNTVFQGNTHTLNANITPTQESNLSPPDSTHQNNGYFSWLF